MDANLKEASLTQYQELVRKVDEKFSEIASHHSDAFVCRLGCHSCCKPELTVNPLEKEALKRFLEANPERIQKLRALEKTKPHGEKRCSFLEAGGACAVYEARPIVCRTHGAPLQFREDEDVFRDVCPLNFTREDISTLPAEDVLNIDTVNTLLTLIQIRGFGKSKKRFALKVDEILSE